jgi:hypothetical protein
MHQQAGRFEMDVNDGSNPSFVTISPNYSVILQVHGSFMFIGFTLAPLLGVYIARYCKKWNYWFFVHMVCAITTILCTIIGISVIASQYPYPHFDGPDLTTRTHTKIGLVLLLLLVCQVAIGFYAHVSFTPRRGVAMIDKIHMITSRVGVLIGLVNVFLGIHITATKYGFSIVVYGLYWSVLILAIVAYVHGELFLQGYIKERTTKPEWNPFHHATLDEPQMSSFTWNPFVKKVQKPKQVWKSPDGRNPEDPFKLGYFSFE